MDILLAKHLGFCYGVKRAIETAQNCIGCSVAHTLGPIIHNPQMVDRLADQGIIPARNLNDITEGTVIIRSHGVGPHIYQQIEAKQLTLVDATCPHVKKAQQAAHELLQAGYDMVVVGEKNHPEVKSIVEWTYNRAATVETLGEAENLPHYHRLGVVVQTTFSSQEFERILAVLKRKSDEIAVRRTICTATDQRQQAATELACQVELMIVVGGKNSANTTRLAELCRLEGCRVEHIETASELKEEWFLNVRKAGITAGASTPDWIIKEVVHRMEQLGEVNEIKRLDNDTIVKGTVISVRRDEVFVDIGYKSEGVIPLSELAYPVPTDAGDIVTKGQEIHVYVLNADSADGIVHLSKTRADRIVGWEKIEAAAQSQQPIAVKVVGVVKGGLSVAIDGLRGFIPVSQIALHFVEDISSYIGQTISALPIEIDATKQRVVLSSRAVLEKERNKKEAEIFATIKPGDVVKGTVRRLADFGAFVDIGGIEGLVHISDLAWHRVKAPNEIVNFGDEVEVCVLKVDPSTKRIALSMKQMQRDPWNDAVEILAEGQTVSGVVTKTTKFGAFVKISAHIEGLVHLSELAERRVTNVDEVVTPGQQVNVKILGIDKDNKRISLSISKAQQEEERAGYQEYLNQQNSSGSTIGEKFGHLLEKSRNRS